MVIWARLVAARSWVLAVVSPAVSTGRWTMTAFSGAATVRAVALTICHAAAKARPARILPHVVTLVAVALMVSEVLALTREVSRTASLVVVMVSLGAIARNQRNVVALLVAAWAGWGAIETVGYQQTMGEVVHAGVQMALGSLLAVCVHETCRQASARLERTREQMCGQPDELAVLGARATADLAQLRGLIDASPVGLAVFDERGRLVKVNPAACALVQRSESELVGRDAALFTHPDDDHCIARSADLISSDPNGVARLEARWVRPDAQVVWVWLTLAHVAGPGGEIHTLAHAEDITGRKRAEDGQRRAHEVIEAAGLIAQAAARGEDPRGVVLGQVRRISEASSVHLVERDDLDQPIMTLSAGSEDLTREERIILVSASQEVWTSGEMLFVDEAHGPSSADGDLTSVSSARSLMCAPVVVDDEVAAVIAIVWFDRREEVTELQQAAVEALAAEAGLALLSERVRTSLETWSTTDPLTGLLNRRGWDVESEALDQLRRLEGSATTIAILDLDHFKAFNDTHGHDAGDKALATFGRALSGARRRGDLMVRWGGEEFVVAMPRCGETTARAALERLRTCVPAGLTVSVGYAVIRPDQSVVDAIRHADRALYDVKTSGRDHIRSAPVLDE